MPLTNPFSYFNKSRPESDSSWNWNIPTPPISPSEEQKASASASFANAIPVAQQNGLLIANNPLFTKPAPLAKTMTGWKFEIDREEYRGPDVDDAASCFTASVYSRDEDEDTDKSTEEETENNHDKAEVRSNESKNGDEATTLFQALQLFTTEIKQRFKSKYKPKERTIALEELLIDEAAWAIVSSELIHIKQLRILRGDVRDAERSSLSKRSEGSSLETTGRLENVEILAQITVEEKKNERVNQEQLDITTRIAPEEKRNGRVIPEPWYDMLYLATRKTEEITIKDVSSASSSTGPSMDKSNYLLDYAKQIIPATADVCDWTSEPPKAVPTGLLSQGILEAERELVYHTRAWQYFARKFKASNGRLTGHLLVNVHSILMNGAHTPVKVAAELHTGIPDSNRPPSIQFALEMFVNAFNRDTQRIEGRGRGDPVALAAKYHHRLLRASLFESGNGRLARMLVNAILLKHIGAVISFGTDEKEREAYCAVMSLKGDEITGRYQLGNVRGTGCLATFLLEKTVRVLERIWDFLEMDRSVNEGEGSCDLAEVASRKTSGESGKKVDGEEVSAESPTNYSTQRSSAGTRPAESLEAIIRQQMQKQEGVRELPEVPRWLMDLPADREMLPPVPNGAIGSTFESFMKKAASCRKRMSGHPAEI